MHIVKQQIQRFLANGVPLFLLSSGVSFCVLAWVLIISLSAAFDVAEYHYYISKSFNGISFFWISEAILSMFIILGICTIIQSKRRLYPIAMIVSCLSVATNLALDKATSRGWHEWEIEHLANHIATKMPYRDTNDPYFERIYLEHKYRYTKYVDHWNEVEQEKIQPIEGIYLTEDEWKKLKKYHEQMWFDFN